MKFQQMTFDEVVDSEHLDGDKDFTQWLADGRPKLDSQGRIDSAVAKVLWKRPGVRIETLPLPDL